MFAAIGPIVKTGQKTSELPIQQGPTVPVTVHMRGTAFRFSETGLDFFQICERLMHDQYRNARIAADIASLLEAGQKCIVLSERVEHCHGLFALIREKTKGIHGAVAEGAMTRGNRMRLSQRIRQERFQLLIATGKLIGEGFDWPEVQHLFFALPFSWKGRLVQYVGRVQRTAPDKTHAHVYDYVDFEVPMLKGMHFQRLRTYRSLQLEIRQERLSGTGKSVPESQMAMF